MSDSKVDQIKELLSKGFEVHVKGIITLKKGEWEKQFEFESVFELFELLGMKLLNFTPGDWGIIGEDKKIDPIDKPFKLDHPHTKPKIPSIQKKCDPSDQESPFKMGESDSVRPEGENSKFKDNTKMLLETIESLSDSKEKISIDKTSTDKVGEARREMDKAFLEDKKSFGPSPMEKMQSLAKVHRKSQDFLTRSMKIPSDLIGPHKSDDE